jgi:hypothetical protein|uniref:Uncharacterized protein n=1 Tax=virus sp. ctmTa7 TaxID=2828255 RepID=A0A8S5RC92_9VIRU|nr:MAG TPA: hypothetical protein [virus sp. ctmTa7]
MKYYKEGRVELLETLTQIIKIFEPVSICYLGYLGLKMFTIIHICKHPELSDEKVKYITTMVSKDKHNSK